MDNFEQDVVKTENNDRIELTRDSLYSLDTIWRWTSFFSVLGFIGIAFMVLLGIIMGLVFTAFDNGVLGSGFKFIITAFYLIFAAAYFLPILYLFRFSNSTKNALRNRSSLDLSVALKNLKRHFQYVGIMTIVLIGLYIILIIGIIIFKAAF